MRITKMLIALLLVLCVACDKSERVTPSGLQYTVVKEGTGVPVKEGEVMIFNFVFKDSKDSVWSNTYEGPFPPAVIAARIEALARREDGFGIERELPALADTFDKADREMRAELEHLAR